MSLTYAILVMLAERSNSGYDLAKKFDGSVGFFWKATHQQIYRELHKLEELGWITGEEIAQEGRPDKKLFNITETGKQALQKWVMQPSELAPLKDEFLVKMYGGYLGDPAMIKQRIEEQLQMHCDRLATYEDIKQKFFADRQALPREAQFPYLTLYRGILYETEWINWCNEALQIL